MNLELQAAVDVLRTGGVVLHATEGVWGLACDPFNVAAVEKILALKQRGADKGLIVIGASADTFAHQLAKVNSAHRAQVLAHWPGAHTWVLPDTSHPDIVRGYRSTLACRVPGHDQARGLCAEFGGTLVSTSANLAGAPAATCFADAKKSFVHQVECILEGEVNQPGQASIIHDIDGILLR